MKKQHDIPKSLTDILTSIDAIWEYLKRFMGDRMLRSAVERELGIIDDARVWAVITQHLQTLRAEVEKLLVQCEN